MGRRPLKKHVQTSIGVYAKRLDKNQQLRGATKGEKRANVGRPKQGLRASERHEVRPALKASEPVHVIMRAHRDVGSLRTRAVLAAIREATSLVLKLEERFRIVHLSIQRTHIHMLVEARDRLSLAKGMQAFGISAAKHINAILPKVDGKRRAGTVFADRYHARVLKAPREVRHCLAYVLNNWRHHREDREPHELPWKLDPCSSAITFDGWKERASRGTPFARPRGYEPPLVHAPSVWLLTTGWRRHGLISLFEVPGGGDE